MRPFVSLLFAGLFPATMAWSEDARPLDARMFCDYVAEFAPQIARNRIRQVPFLRLDEFDYFDPPRSLFLRQTAEEIYSEEPEALRRSLDILGETYAEECRDAFG